MATAPQVSIVIPVWNREKLVGHAIESVLTQTFQDWELILGDGGSVDATRDIIAGYQRRDKRIRCIDLANMPLSDMRNALLHESAGQYQAILDSDDVALPERLEQQVEYLDSHPAVIGVGSDLVFIGDDGGEIISGRYPMRRRDPTELRALTFAGWGCFAHTAMTIRRGDMLAMGGYRRLFTQAEDDDLFLRLLERGELVNLPQALSQYRCYEGNVVRPERPICRAVALASAHLRRIGLPDLVDSRALPFDYAFLMELLERLGDESLMVRLFWIGMLQFLRHGTAAMLLEAWRGVLSHANRPEQEEEVLRHWRKFGEIAPELRSDVARACEDGAPAASRNIWREVVKPSGQ